MDLSSNHFAESNGDKAIVGADKSGARIFDSRILRRALHCHALLSTFTTDFVLLKSVDVNDKFFSLSYPYFF